MMLQQLEILPLKIAYKMWRLKAWPFPTPPFWNLRLITEMPHHPQSLVEL